MIAWDTIKSICNCSLLGIYENQLDIYQYNKEIILHSTEPILMFRYPNSRRITYWKLSSIEDIAGNDLLILKEQETPEPLQYELFEDQYQKHIIKSSSFSVQKDQIKNVSGYGFSDKNDLFLTDIILELEELYISIQASAGSVIETRITESKPSNLRNLIFSS